jgi:hypothetical protein
MIVRCTMAAEVLGAPLGRGKTWQGKRRPMIAVQAG